MPSSFQTFSTHWYACLRALGIRTRGVYQTKHTFVSLALTAGVNVHWLEGPVGMSYVVLRKHYGRYLTSEGPDQLAKMKSSERDGSVRDEEKLAAVVAAV